VPNDATIKINQAPSSWYLPLKSVDFGAANLFNGKIHGLIESAVPSIYLPQ
jgi:hypothetical protein